MNNNDKNKFSEIFYGLADEFGGKISKHSLKMKFEALKDLSIDEVAQAATHIVNNREKTYPAIPTVNELRKSLDILRGGNISIKSKAEVQATEVLEFLRIYGTTKVPRFTDKITDAIMRTRFPYQNWATHVTMKDLEYWPRKFVDAYLAFSEHDQALMISGGDVLKRLVENIGNIPEGE
jgi:hypothetical protein